MHKYEYESTTYTEVGVLLQIANIAFHVQFSYWSQRHQHAQCQSCLFNLRVELYNFYSSSGVTDCCRHT